jgi:hypothetical protein
MKRKLYFDFDWWDPLIGFAVVMAVFGIPTLVLWYLLGCP